MKLKGFQRWHSCILADDHVGDLHRELTNTFYLKVKAMFGLATSSALRREVSALNIKSLITTSFDKAKSDLEETLLDVDDENYNLAVEAGYDFFDSFKTRGALKILTYVGKNFRIVFMVHYSS